MQSAIYKFERAMLRGEQLHMHYKQTKDWAQKHWHNYYEIVYFESCAGTCILNGECYPLFANALYLLTPKDFHQILPDADTPCTAYILSFSEQIVDRCLLDVLNKGPILLRSNDATGERICELYAVFLGKSKYRERHIKHLFNALLIGILEMGEGLSSIPRDISPIVRDSITYMLSFPSEELTLDALARKFGISTTYFSHLFHQSTGVPFKQYLTTLRIEHAMRLLEEAELSILEVGFECGFNTPSQFIRMFKKHTGVTPSVYRAQKQRSDH